MTTAVSQTAIAKTHKPWLLSQNCIVLKSSAEPHYNTQQNVARPLKHTAVDPLLRRRPLEPTPHDHCLISGLFVSVGSSVFHPTA